MDKRGGTVRDQDGNQIELGTKDDDQSTLVTPAGLPNFGEGGYFNKKGAPLKPDDMMIDSNGNLLDKRQ